MATQLPAITDADTTVNASPGPAPWGQAELPPTPAWRGVQLIGVVGPGAIVLGVSIGSGEWILGPAALIRYGPTLLWVSGIAVFLQTVLNMELVRYTMATGEPVSTGFMRTRPGYRFWALIYSLLFFFQVGWPGWAGAAAGAVFYLFFGRLAGPGDGTIVHAIGLAALLLCVGILSFGRHIERTLEGLNWILIILILSGLFLLCIIYVTPQHWFNTLAGLIAWDPRTRSFNPIPSGVDWFLIGAFAAYAGAGGVVNLMLSSWTRDRGFGMSRHAGHIPAAIGGARHSLAHTGWQFPLTEENLARWRQWWRIAQMDQWGIFATGALLAMLLLAALYTALVPAGIDIRGLGIAARLSDAIAERGGVAWSFLVALLGAWVLFKTQLDILDGTVRAVADIAWATSPRLRRWRGGDVRLVYYGVLALFVAWGAFALGLSEPIVLLEVSANVAGLAFVVIGVHVLRLNTTRLPPALRPSMWRRVCLVLLVLFYGSFVYLWLMGGAIPDPARGFLFTFQRYFQ
jgi:hypothetical protein